MSQAKGTNMMGRGRCSGAIYHQVGRDLMVAERPLWVGYGPRIQEKGDVVLVLSEMVVGLSLVCQSPLDEKSLVGCLKGGRMQ